MTVVAAFASAEFGIAEAETESVGVVVEVATLGTSHVGQEPLDATKFVTEPPPLPDPVNVQVVPEQEPAPAEKLNVKAPALVLIEVTPPELGVTHVPLPSARATLPDGQPYRRS